MTAQTQAASNDYATEREIRLAIALTLEAAGKRWRENGACGASRCICQHMFLVSEMARRCLGDAPSSARC